MERIVVPSQVRGTVKAPSSKSMSQRAIAASVLADGESTILNPSYCDDSLAAMSIAVGLGAKVAPDQDMITIKGAGELKEKKLNCGESGLAIRMFSPIAALYRSEVTMTGTGSLRNRPMSMIGDALVQLGVKFSSEGGFLPLKIKGPLKGGMCEIDGSISSQLLTGLIMALPAASGDSQVIVRNLKSRPYIDMTLQVLEKFGISVDHDDYTLFRIKGKQRYIPAYFEVESDWSGGAFLLVAGAINGDVVVNGLRPDSRQSDKAILSALDRAGAKMSVKDNSIAVSKSEMNAFEFDATESPDLFPPLAALASYCKGTSGIKGVSRLVHKESDRAEALAEVLSKMNIGVEISGDYMLITGGKVSGAHVSSHDDHRIAMSAAVAALGATGEVAIRDSHCISKSYPGFFDDLRHLGADVRE